MPNTIHIPFISPVKLVPQDVTADARYHLRHFESILQQDQTYSFQQHKQYYQKWQQDDTIYLQVVSNFGPVTFYLLDCQNRIIKTGSSASISTSFYTAPDVAYGLTMTLSDVDEGFYYLQAIIGSSGSETYLISEPLEVREDHPNTILYQYTNSVNRGGAIFQNGEIFSFRAEAVLQDFIPGSNDVVFEDQQADMIQLSSYPFRTFKNIIGDGFGTADWVADKVNRIFGCDNVDLDGKGFTKNTGAKLERNGSRSYPLAGWVLELRERFARNSLTITIDGPANNEVDVLYVVDTQLFGGIGTVDVLKVE